MNRGNLWVVAGALRGENGRFLMHRRPEGKAHAGLWEFPGGKIEHGESPVDALIRELYEELGVVIDSADCVPAGFAQEEQSASNTPIVILLYTIARWEGEPRALEGGSVDWFDAQAIGELPKPPLDQALAAQLFGSG